MAGQYSRSSGLLLDFGGNAFTLDCGWAHVKASYKVENTPTQFLIHVQNTPDNTLRGSGTVAINGRLVSGMNGDDVTIIPHSETCTVGIFNAKS